MAAGSTTDPWSCLRRPEILPLPCHFANVSYRSRPSVMPALNASNCSSAIKALHQRPSLAQKNSEIVNGSPAAIEKQAAPPAVIWFLHLDHLLMANMSRRQTSPGASIAGVRAVRTQLFEARTKRTHNVHS